MTDAFLFGEFSISIQYHVLQMIYTLQKYPEYMEQTVGLSAS